METAVFRRLLSSDTFLYFIVIAGFAVTLIPFLEI